MTDQLNRMRRVAEIVSDLATQGAPGQLEWLLKQLKAGGWRSER